MWVSTALLLNILAAVVCMISYAICSFYGKASRDEALITQRRFMRYLASALSVHLLLSTIRFIDGKVEIINTMSMLSLFFVIEGIFYAVMTLNGNVQEKRDSYRRVFNQILFFLFAIHVYARYIMGFHDIYYSYKDFFLALQLRHISFFIRSATIVYLTCYTALMIGIVKRTAKEHQSEIEAEGKKQKNNSRMGRLLYQWGVLIAMLIVGQGFGWIVLQLLIPVAIVTLMVHSCAGYLRLCQTETHVDNSNQMSETYYKLRHWLDSTPFPLRESLTMDDIAQKVDIDRDQFSSYIYELRGLTFTSWVRDHRLEYCRQRLQTTSLTLSEIAYESGYGELAAMSKAFKKKYGITPSAFRKQKATPGKQP